MRSTTRVVVGTGLIFTAMAGVAAWAVAQSAATGDKAAMTELMHSILPKTAYDAMLEQIYTQMSATMQQMGGKGVPAAKQKALKDAVQESMPYEDMVSWTSDVYTKHFTRKEIDDLAAFYRTPTGKKFASKLPALSGEVGAKMTPLLMTRLPAALKKRGIE
jgi:hypothetical protein